MKRHKHLWERLCSFENLAAAAREALLGKRGKHAGARFFADWEREVVRLERELREGSYRPGAYFYCTITDPKERVVAAAPFRDRVVHHALVRVASCADLGGVLRDALRDSDRRKCRPLCLLRRSKIQIHAAAFRRTALEPVALFHDRRRALGARPLADGRRSRLPLYPAHAAQAAIQPAARRRRPARPREPARGAVHAAVLAEEKEPLREVGRAARCESARCRGACICRS